MRILFLTLMMSFLSQGVFGAAGGGASKSESVDTVDATRPAKRHKCSPDADWGKSVLELKSGSKSFKFVDLALSNEEIYALQKIKISTTAEYDKFTRLHLISQELPKFLESKVGSHDKKINKLAADIVQRVSLAVVEELGKETAWVCVRSFKPTTEYDIPRWHTDGAFFKPFDSIQIKFASVLKGPTTIFTPIGELRGQFNEIQQNRALTEGEERTAFDKLIQKQSVVSPVAGHGAFFIVGGTDYSAVHSEPIISEDRLFFSVVAGTNEEIRELAQRWKKSL